MALIDPAASITWRIVFLHPGEPGLPVPRQHGRLVRHGGDVAHGLGEILGGGENALGRGPDFGGGGGDLGGSGLLFLGRGGDLRGRRVDLDARFLDLAHQFGQIVGHPVEAVGQRAEFIAAAQGKPARKVTGAHRVHRSGQQRKRPVDRPQQHESADYRRDEGNDETGENARLGRADGIRNLPGRLVGRTGIFVDNGP